MKRLSLPVALAWIVGSTIVISGSFYSGLKSYMRWEYRKGNDPTFHITTIVQTGPQREALKTVYLAELMGISFDRPIPIFQFNCKKAESDLLKSPVIKTAHVSLEKPSHLFVDYSVRQPCATLHDYENVALDDEGYLFPLHPFFAPKKLPEIYLGLPPFGTEGIGWHQPLQGPKVELAIKLIHLMNSHAETEEISLRMVDVSKVDAASYGQREIVLISVDEIFLKGKYYPIKRFLRLTPADYATELGNYMKLRSKLLSEERDLIEKGHEITNRIIDLRIPELGFIRSDG